MRVIAGKAKRMPLKTIPGLSTRPTTDRIKETLFNMMQDYVEKGRTHEFIKNVFSVNREVRLMDIE